jgi:RimJ/RimL family protein N-acetyltransferase
MKSDGERGTPRSIAAAAAAASEAIVGVPLRHGGRVHILTADPVDEEPLRAFLADLSSESIRQRFFSPGIDVDHVALWAVTPDDGRENLVAMNDDGRIIGHAVLAGIGTTLPEFGVEVSEDQHCNGVATALLKRLTADARSLGAQRLKAHVLEDNAPMLHLLRSRFKTGERHAGGAVIVELDLHARG